MNEPLDKFLEDAPPPTPSRTWGKQQAAALGKVESWIDDPSGPQVFHLFGYAGSGKTTLALEIANMVQERNGLVMFGSFTGKAALVMRKKGCGGARTIHSMIYHIISQPGDPPEWELDSDSPVGRANLLIIDECSMLGEALGTDLCSFGTRILVLGDPFQLPPIEGAGFFDTDQPEVMLSEIHRQAQDNPIIRMSMDIREGVWRPGGFASHVYKDMLLRKQDMTTAATLAADQLICGLNVTRQQFNERIRRLKGFQAQSALHPVAGEKIICLKNNRGLGLLNGGLWEVTEADPYGKTVKLRIKSLDLEGVEQRVEVPYEFFAGEESKLDWRFKSKHQEFTYGHAITCHKSQGSQWDNVMVFDESRKFRENAQRWLYTAVTRAAEKITVVI